MPARIHGIGDLSTDELADVLARAGDLADGATPERRDATVGLVFFEPSLRTRIGFTAAAQRLGASVIEVVERRSSERSMPESMGDTVRTVSGYCDVLVVRSARPSRELSTAARPDRAWCNAGDDRGHPSQALIDVFAIERLCGPLEQQRIALVGDLRMRAAQSLLEFFARRAPAQLALVTDPALEAGLVVPAGLEGAERLARFDEVDAPTVVVAVGIPHGAADEPARARLRVDAPGLARLADDVAVLSPLPVIDEIASGVRGDPRMRFFEQSDLALHVRVALLESLLAELA